MPEPALIFDASALTNSLARVRAGAADAFLRRATLTLSPILGKAKAAFPVDTGRTKSELALSTRQTGPFVEAKIEGTVGTWPAYRITWSRWSQAARDKLVTTDIESYVARGETPEAREAIRAYWLKRNKRRVRDFGAVPPVGMEGKQPWRELIRTPGEAAAAGFAADVQADLVALAEGRPRV